MNWSTANAELKRQLIAVSSTGAQEEMGSSRKEADGAEADSADGAPPSVSDSGVRLTTDTEEIDDFILDQMVSKDTCTSKMMEAKRTIDGIAAKVMQLSDEIEAENSIINAQKMVVDHAIEQLEASEQQE